MKSLNVPPCLASLSAHNAPNSLAMRMLGIKGADPKLPLTAITLPILVLQSRKKVILEKDS